MDQQDGICWKGKKMRTKIRDILEIDPESLNKAWKFVWIWSFRHFGFTIGRIQPQSTTPEIKFGPIGKLWIFKSLFASLSDVCDSYQNEISPKIKNLGGSSLLKACNKCSFDTTWTSEEGFNDVVDCFWMRSPSTWYSTVFTVTSHYRHWNQKLAKSEWWLC